MASVLIAYFIEHETIEKAVMVSLLMTYTILMALKQFIHIARKIDEEIDKTRQQMGLD